MLAQLVRTWASGWAVSRGTPRPVERPWGLYLQVGKPAQVGRHFLPEPTRTAVRRAAASVDVPHTWLDLPLAPDGVDRWLPAGWVVDAAEAGHLMTTQPRATYPVVPDGYTVSAETRGAVRHVRVHDAAGDLAAQGQMALLGDTAVIDRIVTQESHRRRGLGSFVMRALADQAVAAEAGSAVLGATDDGRALYETLGWTRRAPLTACIFRP